MSPSLSLNDLCWSSHNFLFLDACLFIASGLFLFLQPSVACDVLFTNEMDGVNWHMMRIIGGQLIGSAFILYYLSNSPHAETHTSCFIMRIMLSSLMLFITLHSKTYLSKHFQPYMIQLIIGSSVAAIAVYTWQLLRTNWPVGNILQCRNHHFGNCLYQLDSFVSLLVGIAWISFPDWLLHRQVIVQLNGSHLFLGRMMGALFCASHIYSSHSLYWTKQSDRRLVIKARAAMNACMLLAQIWSQISYHDDWSVNHWVGITLLATWTVVMFMYLIITYEN